MTFIDGNLNLQYTMEKVSGSFLRLLVLVNLYMSVTVILHNGIASLLGSQVVPGNANLLFKLLLISAVVDKTSFDILILMSWYITVSFLKSLQMLCNHSLVYSRNAGQPVSSGVWKLLSLIGVLNISTIICCGVLFRSGGLSMVILLAADSFLLEIEIISDLLNYFRIRREQTSLSTELLSNVIYILLFTQDVGVFFQFLHIWSFHGLKFTIIDCVILLHLHVAIASISKKLHDRAQTIRICELLENFPDASSTSMCSICYESCSVSKQLACGHAYHMSCLQQLVKAEGNTAKCPLCRKTILRNSTTFPLLRISTEGLFPSYLHIPSFTFEIVRRGMPEQRFFFWRNENDNAGTQE